MGLFTFAVSHVQCANKSHNLSLKVYFLFQSFLFIIVDYIQNNICNFLHKEHLTAFSRICNTEKIKIILILIHTYSSIKNIVKLVAIDSRFISLSDITRFHFLQTLPLNPNLSTIKIK